MSGYDPGVRTAPALGEYEKNMAEASYRTAQAKFFEAQTVGQLIDNDTASVLAASAQIALGRERRKESWEEASNGRNRVYHFTDDITDRSVDPCIDVLNRWARLDFDNTDPWRIVICSSGGSVVHGMKLYSTIRSITAKREVVTIASGLVASMATVVHQAGSTRLIEPGCSYMIHDVSGGMDGSITSMEDTMDWLKKLNARLHVALAEKSNLTVEEVGAMAKRRDSWLMAEEAVEKGFADAIGFAT